LSSVKLKGGASAVHQPDVERADDGRKELTSSPAVGTIHATVSPMIAT
jgi:hypothetical protein